MTRFGFSIDLPVRNDWRNVDVIRSSVQNCFSAVFVDLAGCHALSMVTGELLENAIKYGHWRQREQVFRLRIAGDARHAQVVVENPAIEESGHVERLQRAIDWIRSFPTPADAYRARLREIADLVDTGGTRQLGLVRVAYEGNGMLSAAYTGGVVTVTAEMDL
ncbi:MAG TPA: hypothetical protein VMZ28_31060 [Kofleriaceae bacterium]|nr:hypothetical protein [Kofleriaceae bacterium]